MDSKWLNHDRVCQCTSPTPKYLTFLLSFILRKLWILTIWYYMIWGCIRAIDTFFTWTPKTTILNGVTQIKLTHMNTYIHKGKCCEKHSSKHIYKIVTYYLYLSGSPHLANKEIARVSLETTGREIHKGMYIRPNSLNYHLI